MDRIILERIFFAVVVLFIGAFAILEYFQNKEIEATPGEAIGTIIDYYVVFPESHYLEYEYLVSGKKYKNTINPDPILRNCAETQNCIGGKYKVIYAITKPSISKILLDSPIVSAKVKL